MSNQLKRTVNQYLILSAGMSQKFDRFGSLSTEPAGLACHLVSALTRKRPD